MAARVGTVELPNPVMTASGTAGHGAELAAYFDLSLLGAVVVKSLSAEAWRGNPPPRLVPAAAGMLNSVGLQNPGADAWAEEQLPALAGTGTRIVVSVWGRSTIGYEEVGHKVASVAGGVFGRSVVAVEANISCPNTEDRERMFAHSPAAAAAAVGALVRGLEGCGLPVWAKLSPNTADLVPVAGAVLEAGAAGLTLVNTLMAMAVDPATGAPRLGAGGGGLSGPALHPVAVRAVYECRHAFPGAAIIGVGGVSTGYDAAELLAAGADAVQVGTATFAEPRAPLRVLHELESWCTENRFESVGAFARQRARKGGG
jgi:dihydroorotate dehydrogenase (NAD+) catalytic subunit